ncbi:hypothetical protein C0J52_09518 [Blattella germanica]|nr:hypothetical protein C0J52_09518 [Blattella germanica]
MRVRDQNGWWIRTNIELKGFLLDSQQERFSWAGHIQRMLETRTITKVFIGRRKRGRPRKIWIADVEEDLRKWELVAGEGKSKNETEEACGFDRVKEITSLSGIIYQDFEENKTCYTNDNQLPSTMLLKPSILSMVTFRNTI